MKKLAVFFIGLFLLSGIACSQSNNDKNTQGGSIAAASLGQKDTSTDDQFYKDVSEFRKKLVYMKKEMEAMLKDMNKDSGALSQGIVGGFNDISVDVSQDEKNVIVRADIPGMDKDKIDITLENNKLLRIAGTREVVTKETSPGMVRQERMQGSFERVLDLPAKCTNEGIKANYKNGVLELIIPKAKEEAVKPVKISVQ